MKDILVGIDAGTSFIKAVAFTLQGQQLAVKSLPNCYQIYRDCGVEQNMPETWRMTVQVLQALKEELPDLDMRTAAISITGQGDGTWLIDRHGQPLAPAWLWLDCRAATIAEEMRLCPQEATRFRTNGTGLTACLQSMQLIWLHRNRPQLLSQAATAFHCKDWLYFCMTGQCLTDPSEAVFTFGDYRLGTYSDDIIEGFGLSAYRHLLPEIIDGTKNNFPLSPAAAAQTGLLAGTPVILGFVDMVCAALGTGFYDEKIESGCTILGSTGLHMRLVKGADQISFNEEKTGYVMMMPSANIYAQMQSHMAATLNLDWLLRMGSDLLAAHNVNKSTDDLFCDLDDKIRKSIPASLLYQPYISRAGERGPFSNPHARAGFIGLSGQHNFYDLGRAILEALAFAARDCYDTLGSIPSRVYISGGAARSTILREILAAGLNTPIYRAMQQEAGAAGAAMIAALSIGVYPNMAACAAQWTNSALSVPENPDSALVKIYDDFYSAYREVPRALIPVWEILAEIHKKDSSNQSVI